mmetsp:Transcript_4954/g.8155  ORF Transcript_4954/g.8155 Transcript_4954/m.8155 type:complete len:114 (-) Transcript_4954:642-983(-)
MDDCRRSNTTTNDNNDDLHRRTDRVRMDVIKASLDATEQRESRDECDDCCRGEDQDDCNDIRSSSDSRDLAEPREEVEDERSSRHSSSAQYRQSPTSRVVPFRKNIFSTNDSI